MLRYLMFWASLLLWTMCILSAFWFYSCRVHRCGPGLAELYLGHLVVFALSAFVQLCGFFTHVVFICLAAVYGIILLNLVFTLAYLSYDLDWQAFHDAQFSWSLLTAIPMAALICVYVIASTVPYPSFTDAKPAQIVPVGKGEQQNF